MNAPDKIVRRHLAVKGTQEMAERLAADLQVAGHDITALDLLDCLAMTELTLQTDASGLAPDAYIENVKEPG